MGKEGIQFVEAGITEAGHDAGYVTLNDASDGIQVHFGLPYLLSHERGCLRIGT